MTKQWAWIAGAALGAGVTYFFVANAGAARRARWREALSFTIRKGETAAFATLHRHNPAGRLTRQSPDASPQTATCR